jgi:hypothetical protein
MATTVNYISGADFLDQITITDSAGDAVNITSLPGFEVWYYTRKETIIKFSKEVKTGYKQFIVVDAYTYRAYMEYDDTIQFLAGTLYSDVYVATTNTDLSKGYFNNLGTKDLGITVIVKPISALEE